MFEANLFLSDVDAFRETRIQGKPELLEQRDAAIGLLRGYVEGRLAASQIYDAELMGRFLAVVELWSSAHQLTWHNLRFYFNPITGLLEPIGFDAEPPSTPAALLLDREIMSVLEDPVLGSAYISELKRLSSPNI